MKVLVSGSHGLIGGAVVDALTARGDDVVRLVRSGPAAGGRPGSAVRWDPSRAEIDEAALADAAPYGAVVHLAGAGIGDRRWTPSRRREIVDSRVGATRLLAGALGRLAEPPGVVVSGSAIGYYGDRGTETLTEASTAGTGFLASVCVGWEDAANSIADRTRVVTVRTGVVLSAAGGALARQLPLFRLGLGGRLGDGRQITSWISLRDEVGVVLRAIDDHRAAGPLNATAPEPVSNAALTAALARALHRPGVARVPKRALELVLGTGLVTEAILASQRALPAALTALGHQFADPQIDGALAALLGEHGRPGGDAGRAGAPGTPRP